MFNIKGFTPDLDVYLPHVCSAATKSLDTEVASSVGVLISSNSIQCRLQMLSAKMLFLEQTTYASVQFSEVPSVMTGFRAQKLMRHSDDI
jgi:hypothetical protein